METFTLKKVIISCVNRYRTLHNVKQPDVASGVRPETKRNPRTTYKVFNGREFRGFHSTLINCSTEIFERKSNDEFWFNRCFRQTNLCIRYTVTQFARESVSLCPFRGSYVREFELSHSNPGLYKNPIMRYIGWPSFVTNWHAAPKLYPCQV